MGTSDSLVQTMDGRNMFSVGTPNHQQILAAISDFYEEDERVLSVLLFGSLSLGNWDAYSDLDLDIVMADNITIDARIELQNLCAAIKQKHGFDALIIAGIEEGDVVLSNLVEFSIRYHPLSDTKPAILETMRSLSGVLSLDEIRASANQKYASEPRDMVDIVNECIRYTLGLHHAIARQSVWMSIEFLHRIRASLMSIHAIRHNATRSIHFFDSNATPRLQTLLSDITPQADLASIKTAFSKTVLLLDERLGNFSGGTYQLTASQKYIVNKLKQLQL